MEQFMILLREDLEAVENMSQEEMEKDIAEYTAWVEKLAEYGQYISGQPLTTNVAYMHSPDEIASNGPYIESKEAISGYIIIKAGDMDEAIEIAKTCPIFKNGGKIELRQIMDV